MREVVDAGLAQLPDRAVAHRERLDALRPDALDPLQSRGEPLALRLFPDFADPAAPPVAADPAFRPAIAASSSRIPTADRLNLRADALPESRENFDPTVGEGDPAATDDGCRSIATGRAMQTRQTPTGSAESILEPVAEVVDGIDRPGLPYQVTAMDTVTSRNLHSIAAGRR